MQSASETYKQIVAGDYETEVQLLINGMEYGHESLRSMKTKTRVFPQDIPSVGGCYSGEIDIVMQKPAGFIPKQAKLQPRERVHNIQKTNFSEWIPKGVFYIDTRKEPKDNTDVKILTLHGYDDMLRAEQDYPDSALVWPAKDIDVLREIAAFIGVELDERTVEKIVNGYDIPHPDGYSCREVLGFIAAMYAGNFVMSDTGKLRLIVLGDVYEDGEEGSYLINEEGFAITFGGVRIIV